MKLSLFRSFIIPVIATLTITLAPIRCGEAAVVSARCYTKSDKECTGLYGPETSKRYFSESATALDPPPFFEVQRFDLRTRVAVCTVNPDLAVLGAVAQTGYVRAEATCGLREKYLVLFWQKIGEPTRQDPGVTTTTEVETTTNVEVGSILGGGIVSGKIQVGDRYKYTVVITIHAWICLYTPIIDDTDNEPAGFCGLEPAVLLDVACVEP